MNVDGTSKPEEGESMDILLRLPLGALRRWHVELCERLARLGHRIAVERVPLGEAAPIVDRIRALETRFYGLGQNGQAAVVTPCALHRFERPDDFTTHLVLSLGPRLDGGREPALELYVTADDLAVDPGLAASWVGGRVPTLVVRHGTTEEVVAWARPAVDDSRATTAALDDMAGRAITLCLAAIARQGHSATDPSPVTTTAQPPAPSRIVRKVALDAAKYLAKSLIKQFGVRSDWKVAWRRVVDRDIWDDLTIRHDEFQEIADTGECYYADPFPVAAKGRVDVFVEDFRYTNGRAMLSVIPFGEAGPAGPIEPVLEEPGHLSYPLVFERDGHMWMIPETGYDRRVSLYRASRYPFGWERVADLVTGITASDATILEHEGLHYLFLVDRDGDAGSYSDTLRIYWAPRFDGPYQPIDQDPVLIDAAAARPAGGFVRRQGRLLRPVQDCTDGYGGAIGLAEVLRLDPRGFQQRFLSRIAPVPGAVYRGLHTINRAGPIETVDWIRVSRRGW